MHINEIIFIAISGLSVFHQFSKYIVVMFIFLLFVGVMKSKSTKNVSP